MFLEVGASVGQFDGRLQDNRYMQATAIAVSVRDNRAQPLSLGYRSQLRQ